MMQQSPFGTTKSGKTVYRYALQNEFLSLSVLNLGGILQSIIVSDRNGKSVDIVLGFDSVEAYETQDKFIGALIGRCANRISGSEFSLDDKVYSLRANDGKNHLHGGIGYDKRLWEVTPAENSLRLTLFSEDGEENYPGNLEISVCYTLQDAALSIEYFATADAKTLCNLTNHSYFNLSGHDSGSVLTQYIQIFADSFTPTDAESIPTGQIASVSGTPMDLRQSIAIGQNMQSDTLVQTKGFDHNWMISGKHNTLRKAASAYSAETGIQMEVQTTMPAMQFYSGNFLAGCPAGKNGASYDAWHGFCLETQFPPDAIHHAHFPQPILAAGGAFHHTTSFIFSHR